MQSEKSRSDGTNELSAYLTEAKHVKSASTLAVAHAEPCIFGEEIICGHGGDVVPFAE